MLSLLQHCFGGEGAVNIKSREFLHRIVGVDRGDGGGLGWDGAILVQCWQDSRSNRMEEVMPGQNIVSALDSMDVTPWWAESLTYKRTGLLDRPQKAWSQDGGNIRVFAHEVTC